MMRRFHHGKRWVVRGLIVLGLLDAGLVVARWQAGGETPQALLERRAKLRKEHGVMQADIRRAADIRTRVPGVEQECDQFLRKHLNDSATAYTEVLADLDRVARRSGLRMGGVKYKEQFREKRGVMELDISAAVEGDYSSLVRFINGLERSDHFYLLEGLGLTSSTAGGIKLDLQLKTYFRAGT